MTQFRRIIAAVGALGLVIVGFVLRFDPPTAAWIAWGVLFIFLFDAGLYLHTLLPKFQIIAWVSLSLFWIAAYFYVGHLVENLACPPLEYHGRLLASALPLPIPNPCSTMKERLMRERPAGTIKPFSPDTVFLFIGSDVFYIPNHGHWPVISNNGHVLLSADFDDQGLAITTKIYNEDGALQATVDDSDVSALSPDICIKRPDLSTIIISDRKTKVERLYVHYLNSQTVEFRGLLHYPNLTAVEITKSQLRIGGFEKFSDSCMPGVARTGMIVIN